MDDEVWSQGSVRAPIQYIVEGGHRLTGTIEPSGNKNAALPIVAASLLTQHKVTLNNVPRIRDTETLVELIRSVGAAAEWRSRNTLEIHAKEIRAADLDAELCARIRASILLAGPLLARCGGVTLPPPGGDVIGRRRLDTHVLAFEQLGATVTASDRLEFRSSSLKAADVFLDEPSVTATENALMAAVAAPGTTQLRNAASEPHVQDLAHFLVALGARIEGIGTNAMVVHGPATLGAASHAIGPDHIEVGSLMGLAAVTRSPLRIARAGVEHCARSGWVLNGSASSPRWKARTSSCPADKRSKSRTILAVTSPNWRTSLGRLSRPI
jgi:UDP-N-acetylglucosamine 1-carboxyvinyltransferase